MEVFFHDIDGVVQLEIAPIEAELGVMEIAAADVYDALHVMPERHLIDIKMTGLLLSEPIF